MFGLKGVKRVESIDSVEVDEVESEGFSLEELGSAYAMAIEQAAGEVPSLNTSDADAANILPSGLDDEPTLGEMLEAPNATETDGVQVTLETILESMLFLGTSNNRPIAVDKLLELFRGITLAELDDAVGSLNNLYRAHNRAFTIVCDPGGYCLQLVPELHLVRDRFYGKTRETQLTQSAIDCLSLVAYQQIGRAHV